MIKKKRNEFEEFEKNHVIVDDIEKLNQKYIQLFIDLHTHYSIVDADFYIAAQKALTEQYAAELDLLRAQARHKTEEKFYLANSKTAALGIFSFRSWFKRHDSPMKQVLDERIEREAEAYLNDLASGIEPPPEEPEETSTPEADEQSASAEAVHAEAFDNPEVTDGPEDFEDEPFDLIIIKREIEVDDLEELYALEENLDESSEIIAEKSGDEEPKSELKALENCFELPEATDIEQSAEQGSSEEESQINETEQ